MDTKPTSITWSLYGHRCTVDSLQEIDRDVLGCSSYDHYPIDDEMGVGFPVSRRKVELPLVSGFDVVVHVLQIGALWDSTIQYHVDYLLPSNVQLVRETTNVKNSRYIDIYVFVWSTALAIPCQVYKSLLKNIIIKNKLKTTNDVDTTFNQ